MALIWLIIARDFKDPGEIPRLFPSSLVPFPAPHWSAAACKLELFLYSSLLLRVAEECFEFPKR